MTAVIPRAVAALAVCALVAGCQLSDPPEDVGATAGAGAAADGDDAALGSPEEEWPRTLEGLRAFIDPEAEAWQEEPLLADVIVWLDEQGTWERARLTYVAAEAERMLTVRTRPDELRLQRPRLEGLRLRPLTAAAVVALEPFPDDALEPAALAAAAASALAECGFDPEPVRAVLYATGAPAAWDGTSWARQPTWQATAVTPDGGVVVDPATGRPFAPLTCVDPLLLESGAG